jgi:predicted acyl esterase
MDEIFLQPEGLAMGTEAPVSETTLSYETTGDGLTFRTPALTRPLEITGPVAAKLWLSSQTVDADVFLVLRVFDADGKEVVFVGSNDPRVPVGLGWLRASHRKLDPRQTLPYRPWHTHDEEWPLTPGEPVELESKYGRPRSWCRRAITSRSLCAARTMNMTAPMRGSPMRRIR